ncbi:nucleotide exchange factor GrpE [Panacagrimonas sp.]|uniref:nucleotide exchange factor GrpE n=1 Tax=Panacagrimonas sp. TaxID=2480088 RepID=UPI003B527DAF
MTGTSAPDEPAAETPEAQTAGPQPSGLEVELAACLAKLDEAQTQAASARDAQLRAVADLDNVRKRAEREVANATRYGSEKLLGELLGVADSLDLGLAAAAKPEAQLGALVEGMQLTQKQLLAMLERHGVSQVDPAGQPFNPDLHEAVSMLPSAEVAPNHVLNVMQKGYRLHDRLLRPAMVIVARAPDTGT